MMTDHNAQRWNRPPVSKFTPPSCRKAIPASTIVQMATGTAISNSSFIRSTRICGNVMVPGSEDIPIARRLCLARSRIQSNV